MLPVWEPRSPSLFSNRASSASPTIKIYRPMILSGPEFVSFLFSKRIETFNFTDCSLKFWELPESTEDIFSIFTPADIRRTRDAALSNLETLLLAVTSRLIILKNHPSFPDPELAPERDALNCIRILTRLLPFIYEAGHLEEWEETFFWSRRKKKTRQAQVAAEVLFDEDEQSQIRSPERDYEDVKPLAEELIDALLDLLFYTGFTIPKLAATKSKVTQAIWQSGVGCNNAMVSSRDMENNRYEVLRLLLTLTSKSMYMPPSECHFSMFVAP
jgi:high-temperature-induced dauer-formation protein